MSLVLIFLKVAILDRKLLQDFITWAQQNADYLHLSLGSEVNIGDSLYCASSKSAKARGARYKSSGIVIFRIKYNSHFYCLATLEVELKDAKITLNNEQGPTLTRIKK